MPQAQPQLDTRIQIVTPENIAFEYRVAGPFRRLVAYLMDLVIRTLILFAGSIGLMIVFGTVGLPDMAEGLLLILFFAIDWFYGGLFETFWNGQTPGKHLMRLRVLSTTGQPINAWQAILRNLLRAADAMPLITYQFGLVAMTMNQRFQRLGDLVCGTMVVIEDPQRLYGVAKVEEPEAIRLASYLPANFQVSRSLARALATYVQRRGGIQPARRAEIARYLGEPLREKFGLPPGTSHDLLLCALYYLAFIAARPGAEGGESPFQEPPQVLEPPRPQLTGV
jgi:uncharacterized RDD family membrane protein YckC